MKKTLKRGFALLLYGAAAFSFTACGGSGDGDLRGERDLYRSNGRKGA